jgi:hypothetical protein
MADAVVEPEGPNVLAEQEHDPPRSPIEAGGDETAGSPIASISAVPEEKGAFSSLEDDSCTDESPSDDSHTVLVELPVENSLPKWQMFCRCAKSKWDKGRRLASLASRLTGMSLG